MEDKLLELINEILENSAREPISSLNDGASLRNDIGFDSIDLALLTVSLENIYEIDIFESGSIDTVRDVLERLRK